MAFAAVTAPIVTLLAAPLYGRVVSDAVVVMLDRSCPKRFEYFGPASIILGVAIAFSAPLGLVHAMHASLSDMSQSIVGFSVGLAVVISYRTIKPK